MEKNKANRDIIEIDEEKCDGCGQCVLACAEGALEIVDGKARLVGEILCDGLGACIGECPQGALTVIKRESVPFDEAAVEERLESLKGNKPKEAPFVPKGEVLACGCPSSSAMELPPCASKPAQGGQASSLGHWPIKIALLSPAAPYLKGADLVLLADCAAAAYPDLHARLLPGKAVAMGCPKLDNLEAHIEKLTQIIRQSRPKSLTVVHMEVPCCKGFVHGAKEAVKAAGTNTPISLMEVGRAGEIISEETLGV